MATGFPWINISVYDSYTLVLNLNKLGFQPSKQGRQEIPRLIFQSILAKTVQTGISTQQARETGAPWTDIMTVKF